MRQMNRRDAIGAIASAMSAIACTGVTGAQDLDPRLRSRPRPPDRRLAPGTHTLGLSPERDGLLHLPPSASGEAPLPALLMLHGAGGRAEPLRRLFPLADELGMIVLVPESRDRTWDGISGRFGPDVQFIDRALEHTFQRSAIDATRLAIGGFSDGASYALALGLANGELFPRIAAFSPGFVPLARRHGRPQIFIAHGTDDQILNIDRSSRRIVPALRNDGYELQYQEFDGPHTITADIARAALTWLTKG